MLTNGAGCLPCRVWPPSVTRAGAVYTVSVSVSVPRVHVSMGPACLWWRVISLWPRLRVSTDQNFKCRLSVGFGFTLQLARIGTFRVQYIQFSGTLQVLSYFLPHHNLVDAMETKMQIGVVQCFVSVGLQM